MYRISIGYRISRAMTNRKLVKQIQQLRSVKPDREWASFNKEQLLGDSQIHWLPLHRQAFLIGSAAVVLLAVGVVGGQFLFEPAPVNMVAYQELATSIKELKANLSIVTAGLQNVSEIESALVMDETISSALEDGEKFVEKAKKKTENLVMEEEPKQEVLTALVDVESALEEMREKNEQVQKELIEREIAELEGTVLTEKQIELLEKAREYLLEESYPQALEKIIEISQNR